MRKIICILTICALVAAPVFTLGVSAAVPYDNMIALYNMEGDLKDSVSGKDGTIMNGASFVDDSERGGKVLHLNNDNVTAPGQGLGYDAEGQHAILAEHHIPDSDQMTISIWFKVKEHRTWARVIDFGDARAETQDSPNRFINISPTNGEFTVGTLNINDSSDGIPNNRDRVFADVVNENEWIHAVLVINAKSGSPNVLYLNGKAFQSTNGGGTDAPDPAFFSPKDVLTADDGIGKTYIGRSRFENNGDQIFNGYIDNIAIFNVAFTADQVAELNKVDFNAGNPATAVPPAVEESPAAPEAAPAPVAAVVAPAAAPVAVPQTNDSGIVMMIVLALLGSAIFVYAKKSRNY